eukprot:gene41716-50915_t
MDSSAINLPSPGRRRGRYSDSFKADIVAACKAPGVSTAAVALANSLNANLVRRWVAESDPAHKAAVQLARVPSSVPASPALTTSASTPGFVSVPLNTPSTDIRIELRRGDHLVTLYWPVAAAAQCLSTLQDWLR